VKASTRGGSEVLQLLLRGAPSSAPGSRVRATLNGEGKALHSRPIKQEVQYLLDALMAPIQQIAGAVNGVALVVYGITGEAGVAGASGWGEARARSSGRSCYFLVSRGLRPEYLFY